MQNVFQQILIGIGTPSNLHPPEKLQTAHLRKSICLWTAWEAAFPPPSSQADLTMSVHYNSSTQMNNLQHLNVKSDTL